MCGLVLKESFQAAGNNDDNGYGAERACYVDPDPDTDTDAEESQCVTFLPNAPGTGLIDIPS